MRKFLFVFMLSAVVTAACPVFAQVTGGAEDGIQTQAGFIETLLQKDSVTWKDAAALGYLSLSRDSTSPDFEGEEAFNYFKESGIIREKFTPDSFVTQKEFSGFLVRLFDIKGSLWYSVF